MLCDRPSEAPVHSLLSPELFSTTDIVGSYNIQVCSEYHKSQTSQCRVATAGGFHKERAARVSCPASLEGTYLALYCKYCKVHMVTGVKGLCWRLPVCRSELIAAPCNVFVGGYAHAGTSPAQVCFQL